MAFIAIDPVCGMEVNPKAPKGGAARARGPPLLLLQPEVPREVLRRSEALPRARSRRHADGRRRPPPPPGAEVVWVCPMDPEVREKKPVPCPICGMALEPLVVGGMPSAEEPPNPELLNMSRRFWIGAPPRRRGARPRHGRHGCRERRSRHRLGFRAFAPPAARPLRARWCSGAAGPSSSAPGCRSGRGSSTCSRSSGSGPRRRSSSARRRRCCPRASSRPPSASTVRRPSTSRRRRSSWSSCCSGRSSSCGRAAACPGRSGRCSASRRARARRVGDGGAEARRAARGGPRRRPPAGPSRREGPGGRRRRVGGARAVDESMVTGEPHPGRRSGAGDRVTGRDAQRHRAFVMRAERVGKDTLLAQIVRMVADAQRSRAPIQRLADVVSGWFVPAVVVVRGASRSSPGRWSARSRASRTRSSNAVAVLIIACPCALGLATPMAIMVGDRPRRDAPACSSRTPRRSSGSRRSTRSLVDKTGTLTEGKPALRPWSSSSPARRGRRSCGSRRRSSAASEHPLAAADRRRRAERAGSRSPRRRGLPRRPGQGRRRARSTAARSRSGTPPSSRSSASTPAPLRAGGRGARRPRAAP